MSTENSNAPQGKMNALQAAMAAKAGKEMAVKAEDLVAEGKDWSLIYFEPQVGESYTVKFLMNLEPLDNLVHRSVYKNLPDPKRRGKTFNYVSSGSADTCKALELFFDLYEQKKGGSLLAEQKLEKYMGRTQQGGCLVQILSSPKKEDIGKVRIMTFATYGPNATVANLLNEKLNPTKSQMENGYEKEDVFLLTPTSVMLIECQEATYDGVKGRDFTKSVWGKKSMGMRIYDGVEGDKDRKLIYEFKDGDVSDDFSFTAEAEPHFMKAIEILQNPNLNLLNNYAYKTPGMEGLEEDTAKYVAQTFEKVEEIVPIIRNAKNIAEIEKYGKADTSNSSSDNKAEIIGDEKVEDILKNSTPEIDGNAQESLETKDQTSQSVEDILTQAGAQ